MNRKKGFTLIELLAVIAILAIVILIAAVAVIPMIRKSRNKSLVDEGKSLVKSAEVAYAANAGNMLNNDDVCISMEYLKQNGYYEKGIDNGYQGSVLLSKSNGKLIKKYIISNGDTTIGSTSMADYKDENPSYSTETPENISSCLCNQVSSEDDLDGVVKSTNSTILSGVDKIAFYNYGYLSEEEEDVPVAPDGVFLYYANSYFTNLKQSGDTSLEYDGTSDNNLRFVGANPNNYVSFNNELWRVIGVMNNVSGDSNGTTRIKIVKSTKLPDKMAWDTGENNNWINSSLKTYLNGTYYNSLTGNNLIGDATFYLGGYYANNDYEDSKYYYETMNTITWYEAERTNVTANNSLTATCKIGLMNTSDYGYATSGGNSTSRINCINNTELYNYEDCSVNDWLYDNSGTYWAINPQTEMPYLASTISNFVSSGASTKYEQYVHPVVYLKSNVRIEVGDNSNGTASKPYQLVI